MPRRPTILLHTLNDRSRGSRNQDRQHSYEAQLFKLRFAFLGMTAAALASAMPAGAQETAGGVGGASASPHTIVIKLVEHAGPVPFAFEPAAFSARHGDTLRFVQTAPTMHNVHFKTMPKGAKLGAAAMSKYLTMKGEAYTLVVDSRFAEGKYEIVCDPHELIGMHAFLSVTDVPAVTK